MVSVQNDKPARWFRNFSENSAFTNSYFANGLLPGRTDIPSCMEHWRGQFRSWLEDHYFDLELSAAEPEKGTREYAIQDVYDRFSVFLDVDLTEPQAAVLFNEFLNENPTRRQWWRRFEKLAGPCKAFEFTKCPVTGIPTARLPRN